MLKQRSHDKRQSRTHFYFVAPSLSTSFCVSASWRTRRYREKSFSVNWSSRLRVRVVENASSDAIATPWRLRNSVAEIEWTPKKGLRRKLKCFFAKIRWRPKKKGLRRKSELILRIPNKRRFWFRLFYLQENAKYAFPWGNPSRKKTSRATQNSFVGHGLGSPVLQYIIDVSML